MKHVNVVEKIDDTIRWYRAVFFPVVYLNEEHTISINMNDGILYYPGQKQGKPIRGKWASMLIFLIMHNGEQVTAEQIYEMWEEKSEEASTDIDEIERTVNDKYKYLLHTEVYRLSSGHGLSLVTKDHAYLLTLPPQGDNIHEVFDLYEEPLPRMLTTHSFPHLDHTEIIHREAFVENLRSRIHARKSAINICGFGGLGKTSAALLLYFEECESDEFRHIGFLSYQRDLKTSILNSMSELYSDLEPNRRWKQISSRLRNNSEKTLLIIDNVNRDRQALQDPLEDSFLQEISGWQNTTVLLTSRLVEIPGYTSCMIQTLGNDENPDPCVELFHLYSGSQFAKEREQVLDLVQLCDYHTYVIELMAKSAKDEKSLSEIIQKLRTSRLTDLTKKVRTRHRSNFGDPAEQILLLFDPSSRDIKDQSILQIFAVLPDMESLTGQELELWFSIRANDLIPLLEEDWVKSYQGRYYVNPLVKEATLLQYEDYKVPSKGFPDFLKICHEGMFFTKTDSYSEATRKVRILSSFLEHISGLERVDLALLALETADRARATENRAIALRQYETAESNFRAAADRLSPQQCVKYWKAKYYRGYVLSYTNSKFAEAEKYLKEAIELSTEINEANPSPESLEHMATSLDHYGYVLSNMEMDDQAEDYLRKALSIRQSLNRQYPGKYLQQVAWTADNLGFLLCFKRGAEDEGEKLLKLALDGRLQLASGRPSSEVAWTYSNLACLYLLSQRNYKQAEEWCRNALHHYMDLDQQAPGGHNASMAYIRNNYGMLLFIGMHKLPEAEQQLRIAAELYEKLEKNFPDSYFQEIAMVKNNLANILQFVETEVDLSAIDTMYSEAILLLAEGFRRHPDNPDLELLLADTNYNYWLFQLRYDLHPEQRRMNRVEAVTSWGRTEAKKDPHVQAFLKVAQTASIEERSEANEDMIFYIQRGARKKRIWSDTFFREANYRHV